MEYLDNRKSFFEAVSEKVNIGSYDEFLKKIESPDNRKNLFDALSESYNIGTFEEYESKLGFSNQAIPNQKSSVSGGEQAFTQSDEALQQDKPANKFAELFRNPHQENYFKDISDREAREKEKISYVIDPYQDDDLTQFTPKKEQTYQDIMINQSELFKATPKGQEAYSKLMEKQTSVLGKYIDKYKNTPEYRRHVENYQKEYSTAVGDEQKATIDKKYNALLEGRLHSLYGAEMNTELEPAMREYHNALYETRQTSIDGATQRLGRTYTQAKLPEIKQSINDALSEHQNSPEYKKARDEEFKRQEIAAMFKPELAHTTFATTELNLSLNPVMRQLNAAKKRIEKSEDMIEAALQGKGLGAGFIDQAKRINNWTYGFNDFIENSDVRQVIEKAEKDENSLTKSEKALLDAVALEACAIQYFSYQLSRGYKAGTTTAASVPFMIEFMVNPLSGAGRALAKTLGGWAIKRGITGFGLKSLTFGSRMLGDMLGAAGMTATSSIGRVASGVEERMIGNVGSYADVEGVHFAGREGEQTFGEAVRNSVADNLVENYSEMFFGAFEGGSKAIRSFLKSSPLKGLPKTKVFEIAKNLFSSYDKLQRAVQFHGYLGEVSEEYIGNLLRLGVTTDTEASDVFNEDAQIDTWLGLLPTSVAFGIIGVSGRGINKYSRYKDTHRMNYDRFKASLSSQELTSFENVEAHINAGDTEFTKNYIKETLHNKELNDAQKIERLNAVYGAMYDKNYDDFREVEIASIEERLHNNHYNKNTNGIMTVATDKKSGNIVFVTGAADNGELIVEGIDGKQETVPADRLEDMKSVDYYSTLKSIAEGEFARRRVERLYKEGDEVQDRDGNNFTVSQLSDNGVIIKNSEGEEAEVPFMYFDDNFTSKAEVDIDKADAEIDKQTNSTNGRVTNVKIGGKEGVFYIKAGNLVAYKDDNDNVIIDKEHSDETFVVVDAETGEAKQVGINQIDEVLGDAAPIELKEQSHDEIRNATENKKAFPVGALVYNEGMPNVFTTVIDNGGYGFSIATVNEKTGRLENVPISNDAKEGWKTLNLSEGNVLQTNLSKFEIISNEGNGNLMVSIDGEEAVRMGTAELAERLQYEGFNLSSYIENESKKAEQKEQTPEQLQEEEDDQYSDADLYATVKALYKKREKQEKIANNPIDLTDQKAIKARETAKKNVELLTEELAKWQAIINKRDERKKAEREKQNAISEERRAAIEAERIKQKELERIEREKAQGVPDVSVDNAEDARKRGYRIETGRMVERQQPQYGLIGNEREVVFSSKDKVTGKYKVVEAETLQESHINGKRNTKFFLTEAQPKERTDKASQMAAQKIAKNLNPTQITEGTTAYVGTPITNTRGEIIQGNNRTSALKYMYSQAPEKSAEYKQFLIDNADSFGLNSEEIAAMKNPVLVTEIDVTDEEAIRLGQKNAQDTESGGIQRIDSEKTAKSLGDGLYQFTSRLMQSNDEEQSLSSTIEQNGRDALKILLSKNLINETQYQSAFDDKGALTQEAKEDLVGIVEGIVFANSKNDNIKTMFNSLPQAAKKAILQTVARDAFNSEDVKVVPYIQEAIEIYYSLSLDTVFASAKTIEDVRKAAWSWSIQSQTDFVGNLFFPSQRYTNFALELAVMFKSQTMATQRAKFNELYDKLQGVGGDMFSETELLPFRDAVEKIYNVKLNKELGHVTNDGSHVLEVGSELGEERERGGTRGTRGDEQATSGARSADNRAGVEGDNRQGTSNRQTKERGKGKARLNKTQKEKAKKPAEEEKAKKPAEEEARRKEMSEKRAIAEGVTKKLNIDIEFVENPDELPDSEIKARRAIQEGEKVGGWYNPKTNKAYLYIPNVTTANEVEKTILHEVVAHKGLRGLLGKEQFNALCDSVWQQMTGKERLYWTEYVLGVKTGQAHPLDIARAIGSQANRRAAADEFMAHMAENGIENKTAWQKIVEFVKDALRKMGFGEAFTDRELIEKDIKELLSKSYKQQTRNKENSITSEKAQAESDVLFRFVDNTEHIKDDLEEEKNKYGGKRYKIVGDDIIVSTYFVVENSDQYSEIRYVSTNFDKALEYAKDYYDNDIDSDYVTIDLESSERAIPISEFKENNEEIWGNSFNEFEGSLENYIDTYIDDYLDNAGVDVGYETDEEPVRFVIQKGERDNKYTDKLIWDVEDEIERRFGVKVGKYSSFYVNREGNITDAYEDEQGRKNLSVTMRIADHTHNPKNGKDDLNVLIADKDATSRRFFTATEDLVFNNDYTADEIVDEIEEYWRNYARDNYDGDELDIRFRTIDNSAMLKEARELSRADFIDRYANADFRDGHGAPAQMYDGTIEERIEQGDSFNLTEVAQGFHTQPDDYFSRNGARWYGYDNAEGMQSYRAISNVISKIKDQISKHGEVKTHPKVKVYRAVPKDLNIERMIQGDWVTLSKEYAIGHGEHRFGEGEYKIINEDVSTDNLWWDGNDINEWGYDDGTNLTQEQAGQIWDEAQDIRFKIGEQITLPDNKTLEEYKSKFENPKDIITFALEENTISYGSKQKANETLRETVRNITETGKLRDDSGRKYILHDKNAQSRGKTSDSVIKKVTKRTVLKNFKESGFVEFAGTKIQTPQDIADLFSIHRSPNIEKSHLIFVDGKGVILGTHAYTSNLTEAALLPNSVVVSDMYRKYNASGVYFLHNHPSGNHKVSLQDVASTDQLFKKLAEAGQNLIGHVVIDTDKFSYINISEKEYESDSYNQSLLNNYINEHVEEYEYKNAQANLFSERESIGSGKEAPRRLLEISKALLTANSSKGAIVYLTQNLDVAAYDVFPDSAKESDIIKIAEQGYKNHLGTRIAFVHDGSYSFPLRMPHFTLDVIDIHRGSMEFVTENIETPTINQLWESQSEYRKGSKELEAIAKEMEAIKDKAIANGTFMQAPNGKSTNLNERQWLQVRTKNFKYWFGDWINDPENASKVIDANGEPLVVYHGTSDRFTEFKHSELRGREGSFFFAQNKEDAMAYSGDGFVMPVFLSIQNPIDYENMPSEITRLPDKKAQVEALKNFGYDGWYANIDTGWGEYSAFNPNQIKSATDNVGTFDSENNDIRFRTTAYHGSPHQVDKFSTDYIGTGEGAQAFGWGLYFTSIKDIAKEYATMRKGGVGKNLPVIDNINRALKERGIKEYDKYSLIDFADALIENEGDFQKTLNQLEKWAKHDNTGELQELFDDISLLDAEVGNNLLGEANLYSVTIHKDKTPDQYTWLEWDKPVTERQKEAVRRVFDEITNNEPDYHKASELSNQFAKYDFEGKTGEDIYREISDALWSDKYKPKGDSDKRASLLLLKNGIDGIKYPAESIARGTTSDNARGFNYVVFDENAVSIDEHIRFRIGNKRKADMKAGLLNKLTNATEEQVERTISEIEKLGEDVKAGGDSKTEKVAYHWALKGTVILPEDNDKILQAIKVAEISKVNPMEYNSPMELINNHDHIKLKEKPIDPDTVHTLTNKKDLGNGITIYNVEESEDSRENMRKIINTHLGNKRSPWCLLQGDENGNLTEQSAKYWKYYNGIPKRVAFYEGRLIAFSANDSNNVVWWDKQDKPTKGIPITRKIPNDELERTGTTEYNEETGLYGEYSNIHRGNKENGLYEKWYDNGQMWVRTTYKDGKENGLYEGWDSNGQMLWRTTYKDGEKNGLYEEWHNNGQMLWRTTYKDGKRNGLAEGWDSNGQMLWRTTYKDGKENGLSEEWYYNGQIKTRAIYKDGERKLLPTDVSLQELVDRGELDKKYLYDENAVSIDEHIRFRIGNKRKADMKAGLLNKLTNATEEQVERTISEIEKLGENVKVGGDSKTEKVAYHWALQGTVILPEDNDKILQAIKVAEISKVNPMEYNSPMELINQHDHIELKEKPIDPDTVPTLTNKQDLGNGITVYNVDESEESRENMRKIINTHLGKKRSPWCLLQGDENGQLTEQSAEFWRHYNEIPKRVAFYEGRLIAFSANDSNNVVWWDKQDKPTKGIPITHKIPNDELERTGTTEYNEETGKFGKYSNIHKGNKENGLYEEWNDDGQMLIRTTFKDGKEDGIYEQWYSNGQMLWRTTYKDGEKNGLYEVWYDNGQMLIRTTFKDGKRNGLAEGWDSNGQMLWRTTYKDGKENGLSEEWYYNGQIKTRATYKDGERDGLYERWYDDGGLIERTIYYDGIEIKSLPTDVSLQELVDRGELDKKYLYDENDEENDIRFQKIPEPATPSSITDAIKPDESIIEYAKRQQAMFDGYSEERQQQIRDAVSDNMEKGGKLINRIYKNAFDANQPLERLQKNIQKQGGMVVNGVSDAYNDHFRSLGRATTAYDEFHSGVFSKFKNHLHSLSKKQLPTNIRWADKKNMTQIDKITLYLRAKDMVEAKSLGLPNRGEEGFAENVRRDNSYMTKVTPEEYVEEFERAVGTEDINLLWENVQEVNQWTLNYMEKNNFTDESIKEKYNRKYYVPQRGFEEGEAVSQRTRGRESNSNFNPALRKAKGRKSLSESPLAHMAQIAQSTIMQVEKNNTKRQFLNFCIANMRLGRVTGEFSVDKVHYKKTGRILENGLPEYEEVYGIIPYKELEQDAENRRELRRVKAELAKEGLGESERSLLEKRAKQLSDAIIYEANVRLDQIRPQTKDNLEEHRVEVLYKGKRYSIFVNDVEVANALNRKDGEMGKWMKFFSTNLPFVPMITKYFSRILTQQNPSFALWNLLRDTGMGYMTNIVEHPNWVPTFTKNLTRTQSTIADYAFRGKLSEGKMGDYLKEFFAEGAQTGFSFINRMEDLKRKIERELNIDNTLADKILEGGNSVLQFFSNITEWSELAVRFSQYVTAREHGMTPAQAATEAKEVSVNFDRKGKLRLFYGLFSFFNATMQGTNKMIRQWNKGYKTGLALYFSAHVASGVLNTLLMPDDPEDEKGYSEYDRMTNIVIGSWRIPLPQGLRAFHAIGVQIALAMQGQKTLQAAIMDALSFVFGEWLPINPIDGFYIDPSTNRLRYRADLGFRSFVPTFATPIYDVVTNTTYSGGTVHREPFVKTLDVPATMLSKKGVNGTLQELTDKLFELGGGNLTRKTMMRSDGTRVSELYNWNPSDIEFLTKAFTGGVGQFAMDMFDTGYNIVTGNVNSFDDFAATMPVVKRAYKPYKEETSFNSAYYELLGKIKAAKESYNTLPKERRQIFDRAVSVMSSVDVNNPTKANLKSINNVLEDWNINYW